MTRSLCELRWLGRLDYPAALQRQEELVARRRREEIADQLLLVEHPHVITRGSASKDEHILLDRAARERMGLTVHQSTRGGDVTYHGPGQLVGYPILQLQGAERDAHAYLRRLEQALIDTMASYGIPAHRDPAYTGVWVNEAKLAAIGVRISRWITSHGFALNVHVDLDYFGAIVPCGIQGRAVGSMAQYLDEPPDLAAVGQRFAGHFAEVFQRDLRYPAREPAAMTSERS